MLGLLQQRAEDAVDYDEEEFDSKKTTAATSTSAPKKGGSYAGIHSSGFKDFLLKPEINRAITESGFEHPSEIQHEAIPSAVMGMDVICQAKSGMGKTAVFVLTTLHQLEVEKGVVSVIVLCHTRELANQIHGEYLRFGKYLPNVKSEVFFGGVPVTVHRELLKNPETVPSIVIGTPGRILQLCREKLLKLDKVKHFVVDECDAVLEKVDMRADVQRIFTETPHVKQVMLFSATLSPEIRPVCKMFTNEALEIMVDDEKKLTLHGLTQYVARISESDKNRKLTHLLDTLMFNQLIIFVSKPQRAAELAKLLVECNFPAIWIASSLDQTERLARLESFKKFAARILVSTDLMGRGIDVERINVSINYDCPADSDAYLHRVNRAGRFGTKGLAITFVSSPADEEVLNKVQARFDTKLPDLPDEIDSATYMNA